MHLTFVKAFGAYNLQIARMTYFKSILPWQQNQGKVLNLGATCIDFIDAEWKLEERQFMFSASEIEDRMLVQTVLSLQYR